jgi:hypothetical protein
LSKQTTLCYIRKIIIFEENVRLMKKLLSVALLTLVATLFVTASFAQKQKAKEDYFKEIQTLSNTNKSEDMDKAYQLSKEFVAAYPKENTNYAKQVKDFIKRYRVKLFFKANDNNKIAEAFTIGKEVLAEDPDQTEVLFNLAYSGYKDFVTTQKPTYTADSIAYAQKTLQLFESGIFPTTFNPFKDKQDTIAFMYFVIGNLSLTNDFKAAATNIYKATLYESTIKNAPQPYALIANYYEDIYQKLSTELSKKVAAKTLSDAELKTENEKVEKVIDLMLDAYARALKRAEATNDPDKATFKSRLTQVYQFRKKTEAGLEAFITYINNTAMPDPAALSI